MERSLLVQIKEAKGAHVVGAGLTALFSGFYFTIRDWGDVNPALSFLGGLITGPLYLFIAYGSIASFLLITTELSERFGKPRRKTTYSGRPDASETELGLCALGGFLLTAVWVMPIFWIVPMIPVIGDQFAFMFRD